MAGDNFLSTLLMGAAVIGTGGAALGALGVGATAATAATATSAAVAATPGFFAANAGIFSAISGIASAGLNVMQGNATKQAAEFERKQILERNDREKLQYAIDNANREARLADILSTQTAVFGSRGVAAGSGVALTAKNVSVGEANAEAAISQVNASSGSRQLLSAASQKKLEGRTAQIGGYASAGKSLISSFKTGSFGTGV